jgi:hypothetical protein
MARISHFQLWPTFILARTELQTDHNTGMKVNSTFRLFIP